MRKKIESESQKMFLLKNAHKSQEVIKEIIRSKLDF